MSEAFVAPSPAAVVAVTGADRLSYLHAVTSQDLEGLAPGQVRGTLHLDAHGAPLAMFDVVALEDQALLLVPRPELVDVVVDLLGGRTFLSDATFRATDLRVISMRGATAPALVQQFGGPVAPDTAVVHDDLVVIGRQGGADVVVGEQRINEVVARCVAGGARPGDAVDLEAWRVAAGEPGWQQEVVTGVLPEEVGLLPTHVHLAKGCYPGQEAVARMWMLGKPRRRLAVVVADESVAVGWEAGSGRRRTTVTSAAPNSRQALAFVPPDTVPGTRVQDDAGVGVEVVALVGADLDVPGHDPAVTRRRDRQASRRP